MKPVAKYNTYKAISTLLTCGTPMATLLACGDSFLQSPKSTVSAAGIFMLLFTILLFKDKMLEHFKMPSATIIALVILILILLIENILAPIKIMCIMTIAASGIDKFTFDPAYHALEKAMGDEAQIYKHFGFLFCKSETIEGLKNASRCEDKCNENS